MECKLENGQVSFNLRDLLEGIPACRAMEFVDALACTDAVIEAVAQQIAQGCTDNGSHGTQIYPAQADPQTALDKARRLVAHAAGDVAAQEIERLERALRDKNEELRRAWEYRQSVRDAREHY